MTTTLTCSDGIATVRRTPWDERVLGYPTAEILNLQSTTIAGAEAVLSLIEDWARAEDVGYMNGRFTDDRNIRAALERCGYMNVETTLDMAGKPPITLPRVPTKLAVTLERMAESDVPLAQKIALDSFHHGRLLEDPAIPEVAARQRTANWVADLASQGLALGAHASGRMVGFHCENVEADNAALILTGVREDDSAFALPLWCAVLESLRSRGVKRITAPVSAANTGVINVYSTLGFKVHRTWFGFRKMLARA